MIGLVLIASGCLTLAGPGELPIPGGSSLATGGMPRLESAPAQPAPEAYLQPLEELGPELVAEGSASAPAGTSAAAADQSIGAPAHTRPDPAIPPRAMPLEGQLATATTEPPKAVAPGSDSGEPAEGAGSASSITLPAAAVAGLPTAASATDSGAMSSLPGWVQALSAPTSIYGSDTGSRQALAVPPYTYLRVLGGATARLEVEVLDETGRAVGRGWVDPDDIAPSAPGENWLVNPGATELRSEPEPGAAKVGALAPFTPLQRVADPFGGFAPVRAYTDDFQRVRFEGWVAVDATGPAYAPLARVPTAGASTAADPLPASRQAFIDSVARAARVSEDRTGVPSSVTIAQAILESDWGQSLLARQARNYFGIKALGGLGDDGVIWMPTLEYADDGSAYETVAPFRAYDSLDGAVADHSQLFVQLPRFQPALKLTADPRAFVEQLAAGGYATDPAYATKVQAIMEQYDLFRFDG